MLEGTLLILELIVEKRMMQRRSRKVTAGFTVAMLSLRRWISAPIVSDVDVASPDPDEGVVGLLADLGKVDARLDPRSAAAAAAAIVQEEVCGTEISSCSFSASPSPFKPIWRTCSNVIRSTQTRSDLFTHDFRVTPSLVRLPRQGLERLL